MYPLNFISSAPKTHPGTINVCWENEEIKQSLYFEMLGFGAGRNGDSLHTEATFWNN